MILSVEELDGLIDLAITSASMVKFEAKLKAK
jgi:hypothetical protein